MSERRRCRWLLVDLGRWRKARYCTEHLHWTHPWACFTESGLLECCCGIDSPSRPVAPDLVEATA